MKTWLSILIAVVLLIGLFYALSAALGFLIGAIVVVAVLALVAAVIRAWWNERKSKKPADTTIIKRAEKSAEKQLKKLEREANAEKLKQ